MLSLHSRTGRLETFRGNPDLPPLSALSPPPLGVGWRTPAQHFCPPPPPFPEADTLPQAQFFFLVDDGFSRLGACSSSRAGDWRASLRHLFCRETRRFFPFCVVTFILFPPFIGDGISFSFGRSNLLDPFSFFSRFSHVSGFTSGLLQKNEKPDFLFFFFFFPVRIN